MLLKTGCTVLPGPPLCARVCAPATFYGSRTRTRVRIRVHTPTLGRRGARCFRRDVGRGENFFQALVAGTLARTLRERKTELRLPAEPSDLRAFPG